MNQLNDTAKEIGGALIDMSAQLDHKLDTWSDISKGKGTLKNTERVGFVNKVSADSGIDLVIDVHALDNDKEATLRTWALEKCQDEPDVKLFYNIQLTFKADYAKARSLTERFDTVTRDDIRGLLGEADTTLEEVVICNRTGLVDKEVQENYGKYYNLSAVEVEEKGLADEVRDNLQEVLQALQRNAKAEAESKTF